jgi:DNA polymerase III subunit gamma/tau
MAIKEKDELLITGSLAVRERPKTFAGIVGQKAIIAQLKGAIAKRRLPGTILLHGPAGCGKTTLARVFARYINCETYDACGTCSSCKQSLDNHQDITEINMAKATGKADAEALIEKARYSPRFRVRVFILDEYHQVSSHAENVFLKPLEEPPPGTLWIICTSEVEKLKIPTLSRCLKLKVDMAGVDELSVRLVKIAKREGMDLSDKKGIALTKTIANYSNGQVREAISLLESIILASAGNSKMDLAEVIENFAKTMESSLDKAAARCVVAFVKGSIKAVCGQASSVESCRQLLMKMRWIAVSVIDDYTKNMKFKSYAFKDFQELLSTASIKYEHKTLVPKMLILLNLLNATEQRMNLTNIDERALFLGDICNYLMEQKGE